MYNEKIFTDKETKKLGIYILELYEKDIESEYDKDTTFEHTITDTSPCVFDQELTLSCFVTHTTTDTHNIKHTRYELVDEMVLDLVSLSYGRVFFDETPEEVYVPVSDYFNTSCVNDILEIVDNADNKKKAYP